MTAKEHLQEIRRFKGRCDFLKKKNEELWEEAIAIGAIRYDKDRVQISPENQLEKSVLRILRNRERYILAVARYEAEIRRREDEIERLDRWDYEEVLRLRYLSFLSFSEIAREINRSEQWTKHLHSAALREFERVNKME